RRPIAMSPLRATRLCPAPVSRVPFALGAAGEDGIEKLRGGCERPVEFGFDIHLRRQSTVRPSPACGRRREARGQRLLFALVEGGFEGLRTRPRSSISTFGCET